MSRSYQEIADSLVEFGKNDALLISGNIPEEHRNKFVAVYGGAIVASNPNVVALRDLLLARGIPLPTAAIRFIEADGREACW